MDPPTNPLGPHGSLDPAAPKPPPGTDSKGGGQFPTARLPGLIVKESYWRWPERNLEGNAIDFFVHVLGMSFHDAMRQITGE